MKRKLMSMLMAGLLTFGMIGCSASKADNNVTVVLDWVPNTNHTGLYVALEKGFYKDLGLNVEIMQPPEGGALSLVAAGKAEFAVSFQEEIGPALTSENPLPVVAVASIIDHNVSGIISLKEKGIDSPSKLEGKRYASWDTPFERAILTNIVEGDGGDFSKVELIPNTVTDVISALQTDIDAVWVYYGWDGIATELAGLDTNYIAFRDINPVFDFYTPVLASGTKYLEENEEEAKKFLEATAKGYEYAIANPEEAAEILVKHAPEVDLELAKASQAFLANEYQAEKESWGTIDETRWTTFYDWMYEEGLIGADLGNQGFTNAYLPQ
ncbi:MAG: ABC transporter substrate-binding protein [Zhenhengia sp.]|jgi:ABC-type nitrate/sulfonate/bicarbonate transport system substrate-binding protein|uniref:ABC transporter substrate-binding protein n=1 Tax=Zhenhengia sp. TaxID=2944208 RepID=UPI0029132134|nr:ABC transporter substrate-binding protein [Clostridiales bacterium]MDU6976003.1 ABC transporter substrate-binding protein [Clostridiales bacterium]